MDKAIQLVVVAMIAIIAALILAFLLQNQTGSFTDFLKNQKDNADCSVSKGNFIQACNCFPEGEGSESGEPDYSTQKSDNIKQNSQCSWTESTTCEKVCK